MTPIYDRDFLYVQRVTGYDIVFLGGAPGPDYFPAHVAHVEDERWAQRIVAALEGEDAE